MFELAKVPRELRDKIYEAALVRYVIVVTTTEPNRENDSRSTWQDTRDPLIARPGVDGAGVHDENVTYSYKLQASQNDAPILNLFHTSRQIYTECWPIFYKHNMFDFSNSKTTFTAASMCLAFLNDRPQPALQHIHGMHLSVGPPLHQQHSHTIAGPIPSQWGQLCTKLSGDLSLDQLILSVDGRFPYRGPVDAGNGGVQTWVQDICKITTLRKLEVDVTSKDYESAFDLINYVRARMLVNGSELEKMEQEDFQYAKKLVGGRLWMVVSNYDLPKKTKKSSENAILVQPTSGRVAIMMAQMENFADRMAELAMERERLSQA